MTGIVVTGPPRSGTSATTRLLNLAGLAVCAGGDRLGGGPNNPTGHWESRTVLAINNRLLEAAGARWWCPPGGPVTTGDPSVDGDAFRTAHPVDPWLCKDPRFAVTLPYWRDVLGDVVGCVITLRRPDEVVASLRRTWNLSVEHAAALWARYLHGAMAVTAGTPAITLRFPEILADVPGSLDAMAASFTSWGVMVRPAPPVAVEDFVRSPQGSGANLDALPLWAWELWHELTSRSSDSIGRPHVVAEPPPVEEILGRLRDDLRAGHPIDTRPVFAAGTIG